MQIKIHILFKLLIISYTANSLSQGQHAPSSDNKK
jgi:hypothetical protein